MGPGVITTPPECTDRCRGSPVIRAAMDSIAGHGLERSTPRMRGSAPICSTGAFPSGTAARRHGSFALTRLISRSVNPNTRAVSRTAMRS